MKKTLLLREVYLSEPFLNESGSKGTGQSWEEVANKLNCYYLLDMPRDQRSVIDQFNKLMGNNKKEDHGRKSSSGVTPDPPNENEQIFEEIIELVQSTPIRNAAVNSKNEKCKQILATNLPQEN